MIDMKPHTQGMLLAAYQPYTRGECSHVAIRKLLLDVKIWVGSCVQDISGLCSRYFKNMTKDYPRELFRVNRHMWSTLCMLQVAELNV